MHRAKTLLLTSLLLLTKLSYAQHPANFTWINIESDEKVMPLIRRALHDPKITAIREVGVEDGYALVMTVSHDKDDPTPDYDSWTIYNVALSSGKSRILANGYGVKLLDWIPPSGSELAVTYYSCWGCEGALIFTTLHFAKGVGWRARWPDKPDNANSPQPGAVLYYDDDGNLDDSSEQIYGIVKQPNNSFAVGSWMHSRSDATSKFDDTVECYSIDLTTGQGRKETLTGPAARAWQREICTQSNILIEPSAGQDSKSCRSILKPAPPKPAK